MTQKTARHYEDMLQVRTFPVKVDFLLTRYSVRSPYLVAFSQMNTMPQSGYFYFVLPSGMRWQNFDFILKTRLSFSSYR